MLFKISLLLNDVWKPELAAWVSSLIEYKQFSKLQTSNKWDPGLHYQRAASRVLG